MKKEMKISIVTGASSGLGRDVAKLLCEKGQRVYVVARRKEKLLELKKECSKFNGEMEVIDGDLTDKKFRESLIFQVVKKSGRIDYLINNAGYGKLTNFENIDYTDLEGIFDLNTLAGIHLTQLVLPYMKKKKSGRIINVASVVALAPPVYFTVYNASKYATYGFHKSLAYELDGTGVSTSVVFPSRMNTPFWIIAFKCKGLTGEKQKECINKWTEKAPSSLPVAKYIVGNLDNEKLMFLPDLLSKVSYHVLRHFEFITNLYMKYYMLPKTKKVLFHDQKE